jgi:peptidyl-prolyl cis-trans isomerase C
VSTCRVGCAHQTTQNIARTHMSPSKHPNTKRRILLCCITAFFLLAPWGCSKKEEPKKHLAKPETEPSPTVAKVGQSVITADELRGYLSNRPESLQRSLTGEMLEGLLEELILEEVFYQEAQRQNLDREPEVRRTIRQILIQKLLDDYLMQEVWSREIEEAEIREYYDRHEAEFNRPEQVRAADIYIAVPGDAPEQAKAALREKAEAVLAEALRIREERAGFGRLIAEHSDTHPKYPKGDTGFFDVEGKPSGIDKRLAQAAFNLERVGSLAEEVIETADGYHIIMLIGRRAAVERPLDEVRSELKQRIQREAAARTSRAYMESLKQKAEIHIEREQLAAMLEELKSRAKDEAPVERKIPLPPVGRETPAKEKN